MLIQRTYKYSQYLQDFSSLDGSSESENKIILEAEIILLNKLWNNDQVIEGLVICWD